MSPNEYEECNDKEIDDLQKIIAAANAELTSLKAKYQMAVEALKFYGEKNNWSETWHETESGDDGEACDKIDFEDVEIKEPDNGEMWYGGKLARQTLAELGEKE